MIGPENEGHYGPSEHRGIKFSRMPFCYGKSGRHLRLRNEHIASKE